MKPLPTMSVVERAATLWPQRRLQRSSRHCAPGGIAPPNSAPVSRHLWLRSNAEIIAPIRPAVKLLSCHLPPLGQDPVLPPPRCRRETSPPPPPRPARPRRCARQACDPPEARCFAFLPFLGMLRGKLNHGRRGAVQPSFEIRKAVWSEYPAMRCFGDTAFRCDERLLRPKAATLRAGCGAAGPCGSRDLRR